MSVTRTYAAQEPLRSQIDELRGASLLEFGSPSCGYCLRTEPLIEEAFVDHPDVQHIKIADASRRRLGRSFQVKLWPTLVFLRDGKEVSRLVRPDKADDIRAALAEVE